MKYVAYKKTIVKMVDTEISDIDAIKEILLFIKNKELTCSLRMDDHPLFKKVRIKTINDNHVEFNVIEIGGMLKKQSKYSDIISLELITEDKVLDSLKPGITRWSLISPSEYEDEN